MTEKETKPPRPLATVGQELAANRSASNGPRFVPAVFADRQYSGARIRRWEVYQVSTVRASCAVAGWKSCEEITITEEKRLKFSGLLTTCLVGPERASGIATLLRPGRVGRFRVYEDITATELTTALRTACDLSGVFDKKA
jgi:hypothetical protein